MNPVVKDYLMKKLKKPEPSRDPAEQEAGADPEPQPAKPGLISELDSFKNNFGDDKLRAAQDAANDQKSGLGWAQFAGGLGDALAGRSPSETAKNFDQIRKNIDEQNV